MIVARSDSPAGAFMIAKTFAPGKGVKPFVIMVAARNASIVSSDITGHNVIGSRDRLARAQLQHHGFLKVVGDGADDRTDMAGVGAGGYR
jgi:hypothetical protein